MGARIAVVGARAEVALMVAGVAAGCGAEVVADAEVAGCDLVLVDPGDAGSTGPAGCMAPGPRAQERVVLVGLDGEADQLRDQAGSWRADQVLELPAGQQWLADLLLALARPTRVLAVLGAVGGAGATTVALACAASAAGAGAGASPEGSEAPEPPGATGASPGCSCLLVDADPRSTGLDLPLGIPDDRGARWDSIPSGGGSLVAESLGASLPRVADLVVLTGAAVIPADPRVQAVLRAGRSSFAATVLDAGRGPVPAGLGPRDAVALVVPATLAGVVGAHRLVADLPTDRVLLAVRPTGWLATAEVAAQVGVDCVVEVPPVRGLAERMDCGDVLSGRPGRSLRRIGADVWAALR